MQMTRPFQYDQPLFVRIPFRARAKDWAKNQEFKWKELSMDKDKVMSLYTQGYLIHDEEKVIATRTGDGLEELGADGLKSIVDSYNERIRAVAKTEKTRIQKSVKYSKINDKQRGLIRQWRNINERWLNTAEQNK